MVHEFQADIDAIGQIDAVSTILDVICRSTGMGFAAVARVTEDRWIVCGVLDKIDFGLQPGGELVVTTTICNEIRQSGTAVVIDHVDEDDNFCGHPTAVQYGFQSYISTPIMRRDGSFFGTLCAIDPKPAKLKNPETIGMFKLFAELIAAQLDADDRMKLIETSLSSERQMSELREQFIAVLGHDLRNPVAAISAGSRMLLKTDLDEKARTIVALIQNTVVRMDDLISNVLDFARSRLGGGVGVTLVETTGLTGSLHHTIDELRSTNPDRVIEADLHLDRPLRVDQARLCQLLSNLLGNALTYGTPGTPIRVHADCQNGGLELWVANAGEAIPVAEQLALFLPFSRGKSRANAQGLGLGLYISSEIARAHGGDLAVHSSADETRFSFTMPVA